LDVYYRRRSFSDLVDLEAVLSLICGALIGLQSANQPARDPGVEAFIYSTMASTFDHRPEFAMDGDPATSYLSHGGMDDGDDFIVILSTPILVKSIHVTTGDKVENLLTDAILETSQDGTVYKTAASFGLNGIAYAQNLDQRVKSIRIRLETVRVSPNSYYLRRVLQRNLPRNAHCGFIPLIANLSNSLALDP